MFANRPSLTPSEADRAAAERLLRQRQPRVVSYTDWLRLNALEVERGRAQGRPRVKLTRVDDMVDLAAAARRLSA